MEQPSSYTFPHLPTPSHAFSFFPQALAEEAADAALADEIIDEALHADEREAHARHEWRRRKWLEKHGKHGKPDEKRARDGAAGRRRDASRRGRSTSPGGGSGSELSSFDEYEGPPPGYDSDEYLFIDRTWPTPTPCTLHSVRC